MPDVAVFDLRPDTPPEQASAVAEFVRELLAELGTPPSDLVRVGDRLIATSEAPGLEIAPGLEVAAERIPEPAQIPLPEEGAAGPERGLGVVVVRTLEMPDGHLSGAVTPATSALASALIKFFLSKPTSVSQALAQVAVWVSASALVYKGVSYYFDTARLNNVKTVLEDSSLDPATRQRIMENTLQSYTKPASLFGDVGGLVVTIAVVAAALIAVYFVGKFLLARAEKKPAAEGS